MILAALLAAQAAASAPVPAEPVAALTIPARYRLIEGIAADGATLWFSSVLDRKVVAYSNGRYRDFLLPVGVGAPLGIAWDPGRKWLWVAANCPDGLVIAECEGSALIALDRSGRVRATLRAPNDKTFTPGDVSVRRDRVVVSDSTNGAVYTCMSRCAALATVIAPRAKGSAQGSIVSDDGRRLLLADYSLGILDIDLATGHQAPVVREDGRTLRGVDGFIRDGDGSYLAVRNFDVPGAVVRFRIREGKIVDLSVAAAGGAIHDPTQIVRAGNQILVVGDAQWTAHLPGKGGKRSGMQKPTPIAAFPAR